jgi:hypothetical protein
MSNCWQFRASTPRLFFPQSLSLLPGYLSKMISNGVLINMKAHQQRQHLLRQVTGDAKMALQFPTQVRSNDLTVYRAVQIIRIGWIEFAVSRVKPFLRHAKKNGTEIWVGALPRCNKALGRQLSTVTSLIILHKQCPVFKTKPAFALNRSVDLQAERLEAKGHGSGSRSWKARFQGE